MKDHQKELIYWTKYLAKKGLIWGSEGNLSLRVGEGFFITPSGKIKECIDNKDLAYINLKGEVIAGMPSSEWGLHLKIYQKVPEAKAIVHSHPTYVLALESLGFNFREFRHPEAYLLSNKLSLLPFFPPGTQSLWEFASNLCRNNCIVILSRHGIVAWGETLEEAVNYTLLLEKLALLEYLIYKGGKA